MMKLLKYGNAYDLYVEVNNYLYFLDKVCEGKKELRRFAHRLCYLYEALNDLSFDDPEDSLLFLRNKRKSLRYAKEVKKNIKNIKSIDNSVFELASTKLVRYNIDIYDDSLRDISRYIGLDADKISRVLSGDLSNLFSNKRLSHSKSMAEVKDEMEHQVDELEKTMDFSYEKLSEEVQTNDSSKRLLAKSELEQLKKEIDSGDSLFIEFNKISFEQRDVINSYVSIKEALSNFISAVKELDDTKDNFYIISLYRSLFSAVGAIVNAKFEQIIHLSKVVSGSVLTYIMDRNVIEVFGVSQSILSFVDKAVEEFEGKIVNRLSTSEIESLKNELWRRYKLCGVMSFDINEAVSFDILAFIIENPFTLLQAMKPSDINSGIFKKYDLSILLEFVIPELAGTAVHVVKSLEKSIAENEDYSETDKQRVLNYVMEIFSQKYVTDLGIEEMPSCSYEYFIHFVIDEIYLGNRSVDDMRKMRDDVIDKIYDQLINEYKSLSLFEKIFGSYSKPNYNDIREVIIKFENKLLRNALITTN